MACETKVISYITDAQKITLSITRGYVMGYDLHVVRTGNWFDSATNPVTKTDVDRLISSDGSLSWSTTDYIDMSADDGRVTRYYLICWNGQPTFWWYRSEIRCKNPDESQVLKLLEIAGALGALLIGDDCERYEVKKSLFGKPKVVTRQQ
jgi:hypothetical protein